MVCLRIRFSDFIQMELQTSRLLLRKLEINDAEAFFAYRSDAETNQYQGWIPYAIEDCRFFIKNKVAKEFNTPGTWYQFAIILKENGALIGDIGVHFLDEDGFQAEIGCTIAKLYHKNGFANEALGEVINCLFHTFGKHRITASVDPANHASIRMIEKLGFRKEAHFKESIFWNGKWVDDVIYALLRKEWP